MTALAAIELNIPSRVLVFLLGVAVLVATGSSVLRTIVVPRALPSVISDGLARSLNLLFGFLARHRRTYARRDAVLAWEGPLSILLLLVVWLLLFLSAYALMIYGFSQKLTLGESLRQSGSSLLTLGFADGANIDQTFVDFMAAATGPILIALLIGFLPTIYSAYVDREVEVTALTAQAGEPCWGPELLARSALSAVDEAATDDISRWVGMSARDRAQPVPDRPVTITRAEFDAAVEMLRRTDFPVTRGGEEAWPVFRTIRQRYEFLAYLFCARLQATPAPWSGPRHPEVDVVWPELAVDTLTRIEAAERRAAGAAGDSPPADGDD